MSEGWLSAREALERLGVKPQTLYAYVSRGRVIVRSDPGDPRKSLYRAADIARLKLDRRRGRSAVAGRALNAGDPVMSSGLSRIEGGALYYRDRDAADLARTATLETVAQLLWDAEADPFADLVGAPFAATGPSPVARAFALLAQRAAVDAPLLNRERADLAHEAAEILSELADAFTGLRRTGPIHLRLARFWRLPPDRADLIRIMLVLSADHELNASTFAARVAASTGASLAACALSGLVALTGPRHGGQTLEAGAFLAEALKEKDQDTLRASLAARFGEGPPPPGFGHPLYPAGDPRARLILERTALAEDVAGVIALVREETSEAPNLDFALAAASRSLRLPADAGFILFALGRTAGWLAHAMEQGERPNVIRPRARYEGPASL